MTRTRLRTRMTVFILVAALILSSFPMIAAGANVRDLLHPVAVEAAPSPLVAPTPPQPTTVVQLVYGTQAELENAIVNAQGGGHVTRIVLKANTEIQIDTALPHFDMTDGKVLVIDFNGGSLKLNVATDFWFEAQHGAPQTISSIDAAGGDATVTFAASLPESLQVGDYIKVISEDRVPGGRSNWVKLGEAMKVKVIDGLAVTLEGKLMQQGLYKTQIKGTRYNGTPEGLWLIHPKIAGDLSYDVRQIKLLSLIKPRVISPDLKTSRGQYIGVEDDIEAIITDPYFTDGVDGAYPNMTYGIYSFASKNTWVYRTDGSAVSPNMQGIRHGIDSGANTPQTGQYYRYGNDIGLRATNLQLWDMLNVNASMHSGSWGLFYENLHIRRSGPSAAAGIAVRGDYQTFRNIDIAEVANGWQIYNERGDFVADPVDESPREVVIDGGSTVVSGYALFTSSGSSVSGTPMPLGSITTRNSPYWESSTSHALFDLNDQVRLNMNGDTIKVTGDASRVFQLAGSSKLNANQITIDLSEFAGDSITLFHADAESVVNVRSLNLVNPLGKPVVFSGGAGEVYDVVPSAFDTLRAKWKDFLTGAPLDMNDADIALKVDELTDQAQGYMDSMNTATDRGYLWNDLTSWKSSYEITANYNRLRTMALAWATNGSSLYQNQTLLDRIIGGMEWMYLNRYNEYEAQHDNWWDWEIGAPLAINDLCVLLYDQLTPGQIAQYMRATLHFPPHNDFTGANQVWESMINALRGVLMMDRSYLSKSRDDLSEVFPYSTQYDGFYEDGSFLQHLKHPYNGGYGKSLLDNLGKLMYFLDGTEFEITDPNSQNVYKWIYDSYAPFIYKGALMSYVRGREAPGAIQMEHGAGHKLIAYIARVALFAPPEDALAYKRMIKAWVNEDTYSSIYSELTLHEIKTIKDIMNDNNITPRTEPTTAKYYGSMDRTQQVRPDYAFGVSMHSSRIFNYESANGENMKGWYTSDGMTYLYNGDLAQFDDYFWQTVNPYRLPGTTVDTRTRTDAEGESKLGQDWVGGAMLNNQYGATGMHLKAFSSLDNPSTLQAQKSWFMFDDEIVALGAAISSTDNRTIETIVDNRKLNAAGDNALTVDGVSMPPSIGWNETMNDVNWIHLAGNVTGADMGYYFPDSANVNGLREERSYGAQTRNYMNLVIDHGKNPNGGAYSYVLLPNKSSSQVGKYAASPDITILQNDDTFQAVKENTLNITGINLWKNAASGTFYTIGDVSVDKKASIMMKEYSNAVEVAVSDPTQLNSGKISVQINKEAVGVLAAAPEITVTQLSPTIKFTIATKGKLGKSFKVKFALSDPSVIQLNPTADSHVVDGVNADTNYGKGATLDARESATAGETRRSYLKFDLSGISGTGYTARLRIYGRSYAVDSASVTSAVYEVADDNWTETGIKWNNKPATGNQIGAQTFSTIGQWRDYDVTAFVKNQLANDQMASFAVIVAEMEKLFKANSRDNSANKPVLYLIPDQGVESNTTEDAYVRMGTGYSDVNYGGSTALAVKDHWSAERQTYLKFDLGSVTANANSVKLKIYGAITEGTQADYKIYSVLDDSWTESGITWDNKPTLKKELTGVTFDTTKQWKEIDLTAYVKEQMEQHDGIVSIAIIEDSPGGGHYLELRSREYAAAYAPRLVLD